MATEVAIRAAIVDRIKTFTASLTPPPLVLERDISKALEEGIINDLRDSDDRIHCITVTQSAAIPNDVSQNDGVYDLWFDVTQWTQYRSGTDASNSVNEASVEREKMIDAFRDSNQLSGVLRLASPIIFPRGSIGPYKPAARTQVHQAKGQLLVVNAYGCS